MIERLAWDSAFFGFGVGRLPPGPLTPQEASACRREALESGIACVYYLARADDPESWAHAIANGFSPMDVRIELETDGPLPDTPTGVAVAPEIPALQALARDAFVASRFFADRRFPREKARELFAIWIDRGVREEGFFTAVVREDDEPAAFVSARISGGGEGRVELVAVGAAHRSRGLGRKALDSALAELRRRGAARVRVATQAANFPAIRLYEAAGFRAAAAGLWFHGWFE
jgi:ribosomal protein S18 acetylase RimI-like enzyme